nr:hypothetical protein KitaXyl93_23670 [Kitasatospora sp. Xyl93]
MANEDALDALGSELDRMRAGAGLSVTQLAKASGLSRNTVSAALNAQAGRKPPSTDTLTKIVRACGGDLERALLLHRAAKFHRRGGVNQAVALPVQSQWITTSDASEPLERFFNPLRQENLVRSVSWALRSTEPIRLDDHRLRPRRFPPGGGLYALYYAGDHEAYAQAASEGCETPLYVGSGSRGAHPHEYGLWRDLRNKVRLIDDSENLAVADFRVRFLLVEDIFVRPARELLIRDHMPLWNVTLTGFTSRSFSGDLRGRFLPWHGLHNPERVNAVDALTERTWREVREHFQRFGAGWREPEAWVDNAARWGDLSVVEGQ